MKKQWYCWAWADASGEVFFIGAGPEKRGVHPADRAWAERHRADSHLNRKLCTFVDEPQRLVVGYGGAMSREAAEALRATNVANAEKEGRKLLSSRHFSSYLSGGGKAKPVVSPDGDLYESARAAGRDVGVAAGNIVRWIKRDIENPKGWRYL